MLPAVKPCVPVPKLHKMLYTGSHWTCEILTPSADEDMQERSIYVTLVRQSSLRLYKENIRSLLTYYSSSSRLWPPFSRT